MGSINTPYLVVCQPAPLVIGQNVPPSLCLKLPIAGTQELTSPTATAGKKEAGT